ncbi:ABC transporter substrate-binding protein [Candidatus Entotheonella palauensis]|uniref:ABC transporter substrate-binding protein n=1 Tax=Candidatus Entotheonella palauensis TaxID=93172 RepID=UPI000B7D88C3|nr:ABC transporter substrate-binding protein [Candidatus Entotheonella palauensis]
MTKRVHVYIGGMLLILTLLGLSACPNRTESPLRLGTNVWPGYEPLYLARELGYFNAKTITLVEYLSASEVIRAFRNQTLEAAALTLDEVLLLLQYELPVQIFLVTDISHGGDVILSAPSISQFADLVGKRVGVEATALGAYVISRALEQHDLALSDIAVVPLEVGEHAAAYQAGKVDAVVTFEPVRSQLLALGARELFTSREIPGEIVDVLVVHQTYFETHPSHVSQVVDGWFRALDYFAANPHDAALRMQKRLKLSPGEVLKSYEGLRLPDRAENRDLLGGPQPALRPIAERLRDVMVAKDLLRAPVVLNSLFNAAALGEDPS